MYKCCKRRVFLIDSIILIESIMILLISFIFTSCRVADNKVEIGDKEYPFYNLLRSSVSDDISFIHITDTHGSDISLIPAIHYLRDLNCNFGIITGDILPTEAMLDSIKKSDVPILLVPGNHDIYEVYGQIGFRTKVLDVVQEKANVVFGSKSANYWYKDISKNGLLLRVIGLDQYESQVNPSYLYNSSELTLRNQIDWFINILEHSYECDGIIVLMHCGFGNSIVGNRDTNNANDFISILAKNYYNGYDYYAVESSLLVPEIISAYKSGQNIHSKVFKKGYLSSDIIISTNFSGPHTNFVGYFGGHLHWDEVEYLNHYNKQLQVLMAYCGIGTGSHYNDLLKTNTGISSYNMNLNIINFKTKTLKIYRIGANQKIDGTSRDSILFNY